MDDIEKIHSLKTGKLNSSIYSYGSTRIFFGYKKTGNAFQMSFGSKIGLAFQIYDDILDETGDSSVLGKSIKSDIKNQKQTLC